MTQGHQWPPRSDVALIHCVSQKSFGNDERRGPVSQLFKGMTVLQLLLMKATLFSQLKSDMEQRDTRKGHNCGSTSIQMALQAETVIVPLHVLDMTYMHQKV